MNALTNISLSPNEWRAMGVPVGLDGVKRSAADILSGYGGALDVDLLSLVLEKFPSLTSVISEDIRPAVSVECRYAIYIKKQEKEIEQLRRHESMTIPEAIDYKSLVVLSSEEREKLSKVRPRTIGAAARIDGVTPHALIVLMRFAQQSRRGEAVIGE
jgi:tRNA uridine 5-carboxymethylaminomethyl modification enzyme